jgi:tRNA A-37 threonylcarbamoyl transferase component Bud32
MEKETWRRIDGCLADALELPPAEREGFLRSQLGDTGPALVEALKLVGQAERAEKLFAKGPVAGLMGLEAGARLGPWELVRPLGSGGMGVVWLARRVDGQATMQAAIKLLPPALSGPLRGDQDLRQRFLMEKQILARLQHPNIARLLDASAGVGDTPNFVMEYIEGVPLMEYLQRNGVERLALFLKICEAVQYAHANLVIHRDLKPQNILVNEVGEPKLLDFGIGKILNDPAGDASITLRRAFSLDYASPEQIRGGVISTATDVYSLGLILFEMLTGVRARRWNDKALGEVLAESERFVLPQVGGLSADLRAVLGKATVVEEELRYRSVSDFAADVSRLLDGRPVEARAAGAWYQVRCFARRHRLAVGASAVALSLILGLGTWGWISASQAESRSRELQVALQAEKTARLEVEAERRNAERQGTVAREMGGLAEIREKQSEERLKDLLRVFDSVIAMARWDIAKLPGGTSASIKLLEKSLGQIEAMQATESTRTNYLLLRAEAHGQLAELYGGANSNVGEMEKGKLHRRQSIELWQELHRLGPGRVEWERGLEEARFRASLNDSLKMAKGASAEWKAFEKRFLNLSRRAPNSEVLARTIGTFYFYFSTHMASNDPLKRTYMEEALGYFEKGGSEANLTTMRDQALAHKYLAGLVAPEKKLFHASEALRLDRLRVSREPNDAGASLDLGFSIVSVADAHSGLKRDAEAQRGYWDGYELRKRLAMMDAKNVFVWRSLVYPIRLYGWKSSLLQDWKALEVAVKEMEWVGERVSPPIGNLDRASLRYWKGLLAEQGSEACAHFIEAGRLLEAEPKGAWVHSRKELVGRVQACRSLIQ